MAKQLGIHQIKGKVGQRSYYRTKGVVDGISRSINQGMSARVKNGEEYANTRLNNAEFKNANAIASAAFNSVTNRNRGMMRNFAIAEMTKKALEDIKVGTGDWGKRHPLSNLDSLIVDLLENHAKGGSYQGEFGDVEFETPNFEGSCKFTLTISPEKQIELNALGIDALQVIGKACLAGEVDVDDVPRLFNGGFIHVSAPVTLTGASEVVVEKDFDVSTPSDVGMSQSGYTFATDDTKHGFYYVATILPMRKLNNKLYVLQDACTYVAGALGQIPEE